MLVLIVLGSKILTDGHRKEVEKYTISNMHRENEKFTYVVEGKEQPLIFFFKPVSNTSYTLLRAFQK